MSSYIVLHGFNTSTKTPVAYVEHIVYGAPRIDVVEVGSRFVAILEYADSQDSFAANTFRRMGSFSGIGASLNNDLEIALREFGVWVRHYAPGTVVGLGEEV